MESAAGIKCFVRLLAALLTAGLLGASVWAAFDQDGDPPAFYVHGTITTQTWTKDNVYIVDGNAGIPVSHTLTIEPGTVVRFDGYYILWVDGELVADGTAEEPIRFTSNFTNPDPGDWNAIWFTETSVDAMFDGVGEYIQGSIVRHAIFKYGHQPVRFSDAAPFIAYNAVYATDYVDTGISGGTNEDTGAGPVIVGNVFTDASLQVSWNDEGFSVLSNTITGGYLRINKGAGTVAHNSVSDVPPADPMQSLRIGIYAHGSLDVIDNQVMRCDRGIQFGGTGLISGNLAIGNRGHGIAVSGSPTVVNNTSWLNDGAAMVVDSGGPPVLHYNNLAPRSGQYALRNNTTNDVDATNNWWGTTSEAAIQAAIYDGNDEYGYGIVDYSGYLLEPIGYVFHSVFLPSVLRE
jgi:hypothetical protein